MKAIVLYEYGGPGKLKYEDAPDPVLGEGEVLIRQSATSVNPIDWKMRSGEAKERFPVQFPAILGRDVAGIVRQIGPKVTGFAPGDKVLGVGNQTYAELLVAKAVDLARLPEGADLVHAAALPLVTTTGEQLISRGARIQFGQTILITGALGSVGRTAVFVAKKAGATVIAGVRASQLSEAEGLGADEVLALDDEGAVARLGFVDAIADTVNGETAERLIAKVKQGGTFASVVGPPANAKLHPTIRTRSVRAVPDAAALRALAEDCHDGHFAIPIDRLLPLEKAGEAQAAAQSGGIGKILLVM